MMEEKFLDARIKVLLIAAYTLCGTFGAVVLALIAGMFAPNELVDNEKVFTLLSYIVTAVAGAITGGYAAMMGFKADKVEAPDMAASVEAPVSVSVTNDIDNDDSPLTSTPVAANETFFTNSKPDAPIASNTGITPLVLSEGEAAVDDDDDDDMAPWEKHRNDLRYDVNGDGVVDENDFPDWRSAGK